VLLDTATVDDTWAAGYVGLYRRERGRERASRGLYTGTAGANNKGAAYRLLRNAVL